MWEVQSVSEVNGKFNQGVGIIITGSGGSKLPALMHLFEGLEEQNLLKVAVVRLLVKLIPKHEFDGLKTSLIQLKSQRPEVYQENRDYVRSA